jgi:hypothetical protein
MADDKNFKALIAEQKKTTDALNKLAGIEEQSLDKKTDDTGTPPSSDKEDEKDRSKALANAIGKPLGKFGKGIMNGFKKLGGFFKDKASGAVTGLGSLLKFGLMGAALFAVTKFLKSPLWDKTKTFLIETALPALKELGKFLAEKFMLVFDFLKDKILPIFVNLYTFLKDEILPIFTDYIVKTWDNIKVLFTDISDAFSKIFGGDILGGLMDLICGIGSFIGKQINAIATGIYNIIAKIFGLKETDSVFGSIGGFFKDMKDKVVGYISVGWNFIKEKLAVAFGAITDIGDWIGGIFCKVVDWIKGIFSWGSSDEDGSWSLITFITTAFDKVKAWFLRIFTWGKKDGEEGWSLSKFINTAWCKVKEWILGIFAWGKKDSEEGWSLSTFINTAIGKVKKWITGLFSWASKEDEEDSWLIRTIKSVVNTVKCWLGSLFKFDSTSNAISSFINILTFIPNMIIKMVGSITSWLLGLFGFDDAAKKVAEGTEKFSIGAFIMGIVGSIVEWFTDLFDIDWKALAIAYVPDWIKNSKIGKWLGFGGGDDIESVAEVEKEMITTLPRAPLTIANAFPMEGPPVNGGSTNIIHAPTSSVQTTNTNIVRYVIEPDVYFLRQAGFAL